jgi:hypothetical protein
MTQTQFNARAASLLKAFEKRAKRLGLEEARKLFREDRSLIYVKTYTVSAHFRRPNPARAKQPPRLVVAA